MSPLQWALLILAAVAVIAIYLFSRRDRRALDPRYRNDPAPEADEPLLPPRSRQLDIFGTEPPPRSGGPAGGGTPQFDEFGVSRPRRVDPQFDTLPTMPPPATPPAALRKAPSVKTSAAAGQKIVSLLIAARSGGLIHGDGLHAALAAQGLQYGAKQIYHRLHGEEIVFSVASLLKPGFLDPAAAENFATPGLTVFMVLPGPMKAVDAVREMIDCALHLAESLEADVFDSHRQSFTAASARTLQHEVENWARFNIPI